MAKKDKNLLGGFEFKKFDGLDNGIDIPISNSLKEAKLEKINKPVDKAKESSPKRLETKPNKNESVQKGSQVSLPRNFDFKGKGIEPMVNVVPTPKEVIYTAPKVVPTKNYVPTKPKTLPTSEKITSEGKVRIQKDLGFDWNELGALQTKQEKVLYLAMRGWRLSVEQRRGALFHYAIKYFNRRKERIYLGSINS